MLYFIGVFQNKMRLIQEIQKSEKTGFAINQLIKARCCDLVDLTQNQDITVYLEKIISSFPLFAAT